MKKICSEPCSWDPMNCARVRGEPSWSKISGMLDCDFQRWRYQKPDGSFIYPEQVESERLNYYTIFKIFIFECDVFSISYFFVTFDRSLKT